MRPRAALPALLLTGVVLLACRPDRSATVAADSTGAADSAGPASAGAGVVTVTASDFSFDAPAEVPAGLTTFRLVSQGPSLHHIQLVRLEEGKTTDDFMAALKAGGPPPNWAIPAGGPNPPETGDTTVTTLPLEEGNYAMVCFIPSADGVPHLMKGMVRPLRVTAAPAAATSEPATDLVMKLNDYGFDVSGPLTAGRHVVRVENDGPQPHEVAIVRLEPGKSPEDFANWAEKPVGPNPGKMAGGISGIMPGTKAWIEVNLEPGEYALLCFFPDGKDGKAHFLHGMAKRVTVS